MNTESESSGRERLRARMSEIYHQANAAMAATIHSEVYPGSEADDERILRAAMSEIGQLCSAPSTIQRHADATHAARLDDIGMRMARSVLRGADGRINRVAYAYAHPNASRELATMWDVFVRRDNDDAGERIRIEILRNAETMFEGWLHCGNMEVARELALAIVIRRVQQFRNKLHRKRMSKARRAAERAAAQAAGGEA